MLRTQPRAEKIVAKISEFYILKLEDCVIPKLGSRFCKNVKVVDINTGDTISALFNLIPEVQFFKD